MKVAKFVYDGEPGNKGPMLFRHEPLGLHIFPIAGFEARIPPTE